MKALRLRFARALDRLDDLLWPTTGRDVAPWRIGCADRVHRVAMRVKYGPRWQG